MSQHPRVEERAAQPYVAIPRSGPMEGFRAAIDGGFPELYRWLAEHRVEPTGPPFVRYVVFDVEGGFEVELAAPVAATVPSDDRVRIDALPAGRYVTLLHVGAYRATSARWEGRDLAAAHLRLQAWADQQGIVWDGWETDRGPAFRARVEQYLVGPPEAIDPATWETELTYLTAASRSGRVH